MRSPTSQYESYLLRLWRAGDGNAWRAMLECTHSNERHSFADLESLCAFLRQQTGSAALSHELVEEEKSDDL